MHQRRGGVFGLVRALWMVPPQAAGMLLKHIVPVTKSAICLSDLRLVVYLAVAVLHARNELLEEIASLVL